MELVIVTGMSGAGKSKALDLIEDIGYYCVDNMPPQLIPKFAEICSQSEDKMNKVAIGADIRNIDNFDDLFLQLKELKKSNLNCKMIFMDCSTEILLRRFKETRRKHPLSFIEDVGLEQMVERERKMLAPLYDMSDRVIDTTSTTIGQLWNLISGYLIGEDRDINISIVSFGYKYGLPRDCDFVFDLRALPNPFYVSKLKEQTGLDAPVYDYIFSFKESDDYFEKISELMTFLMPRFIKEGRSGIVIGFGCTGGKHRSVAFAKRLCEYFESCGKKAKVHHRELSRELRK